MTPEQFKAIRASAGLTQSGLAAFLRLTLAAVQHYEYGVRPIPGPVSVIMELVEAGKVKP